jgi:hypothetical protein
MERSLYHGFTVAAPELYPSPMTHIPVRLHRQGFLWYWVNDGALRS